MKQINFFYVMLLSGFNAICQNPQLLKDVYPGSTGSGIQQIVKTSNYTFFNAEDEDIDLDRGLYRTDGTPGGTIKLNLTYPTYISTKAEKLTALGDKIVFAGDNSATYGEIWMSDGTQAGTIALERFQPNLSSIDRRVAVMDMARLGNNMLYGVVNDVNHSLLKKTDGTPGGTSVVYDFSGFASPPDLALFKTINNILYFNVYDIGGSGIDQLWRSDGTTVGTYMLKDFGSDQYVASTYMIAGNLFYWMVVKPGTGNVLWKSDGTAAGTVSVKTIGTTGNNNYPHHAAIGSTLYFAGLDVINGKELWKTDGTEAGTMMVQNINVGAANSSPTLLTVLNNNLYFYADGGVNGNELWKYDGTSATEVLDIYPGSTGSKPLSNASIASGFVESNGTIIFNAANDATGQELWITDGTAANTKKIRDINPLGASNPSALTPGNPVYFSATNGVNGSEIFKFDNSNILCEDCGNFVAIPDPNFEQALIDLGFDKDGLINSKISISDAEAITDLNLNNKSISNLSGIEYFVNLRYLYCNGNLLSAIDLSNNPYLINLHCGGNALTSIDLANNLNLVSLHIYLNKLTSLDVGHNPNLEELLCSSNKLTSMDISGNPKLKFMNFADNKLLNLNIANGNNANFTHPDWANYSFDARSNPTLNCIKVDAAIINTVPTDWFKDPSAIYNTDCPIINCNDLVAIPDANFEQALINLGFDTNGLTGNIKKCDAASIIDLDLNNKSILSLSGIEHFVNLRYLYCNGNSLTAINLSNSPNLINLHCGTNALTSIDLSNNPNLASLHIYLNKLTTLDVSHNLNLEELLCSSNKLTSMDITGNPKLKFMNFADNKLLNLNIANGNNANFTHPDWANYSFDARYNPALNCIKVDAAIINTIPTDWFKDVTSSYSTDSCESLPILYVNDNNQTGDVYTATVGNDANPGTAALPFATIQYAINRVAVGGVIYVDAGTYAERIFVNKPLSLKGANAGSNPGTSLNRGLSESILLPSTDSNLLEIITVQSSDVSIDGFLFDGDNPGITGSVTLNEIDVNAGMGIYNGNLGTNNLVVQNNIFKNFFRYGMLLQSTTAALSGINVSRNHIDNVSSKTPRDGRGIGLFNNAYATVTDNYLTRVNTGVIMANFNIAGVDSVLIESNTIEAYSYGIIANGNSNLASSIVINSNQLTVSNLAGWSAPGSSTVNNCFGVGVFNLTSTKNVSITNNTIAGTRTGINTDRIITPQGIQVNGGTISNSSNIGLFHINRGIGAAKLTVNNISLINNVVGMDASAADTNNMQLEFSGVTIDGGTTGIRFYGQAISLPSNTLSGVSFSNQTKEYILQTVNSFHGQTIDVSTVNFDGITPADMTLAQLFATEDKLTHKIDFDYVGYFKLKPNEVFVTPNSFAADLPPVFGTPTISPEINRAVGSANPGDVIHVKAGTYINQINIDKAITIKGEGKELTLIQGPTAPITALPDFGEKGIIQSLSGIGDVNIENLSIDGTNSDEMHSILIQGGGRVSNCEMRNANNGIFFRVESAIKTAVAENNIINAEYIGVNFQGSGLTASLINNTISVANQGFSAGIFAGLDFGPITQLTVTGNSISNYATYGFLANSNNSNITQNSIVGNGTAFSTNNSLQATCNWFGTANAAAISSKISGTVNYTPWLTNGTDSDLVSNGFQPLPDVCNGSSLTVTLDPSENITCNGANNGTISITTSNGITPFSFLWTNSDDPGFSSTDEDLSNLKPGTYHLLLTDSNGSTASLSDIVISEPDLLTASASGIENICFGASEGTAFVLADGGVPPYNYLWSNNEITDEISNLAAGTYSVTVTDANGCTTTASYEVTQPTMLTATIVNNSTICSNNATVTVTAGTGTPGYTFLWSNGAITTSINNVPVGTYTVMVTDAKGCTTTASITLSVGESFNPSAAVTNVSCFGASNGAITITNANGTAPFTFSIDGSEFLNGALPYSFNGLSAGTYNIAVKDANGCVGFVTKSVSQPTELTATIITVQATCFGQNTGSVSVGIAGGSGALSYSWTGTGNYTSTQKNISGLAAGSYALTVTDNNGCTVSLNVVVPNSNPITVSETITPVSCRGTLTGAIDLTVSGGSESGFTYSWTGSKIAASEDITNLGAGSNYNVTITDIGSGCTVTKSYSITQPASNLSLSATKTNATGCNSMGTITATGSGGTAPYEYKLNGSSYQDSGLFTGLSGGSYTVWVKDVNGCTLSKIVAITDNGTDAYESNNSKSQAKLITIDSPIKARIALATDTADWFKFTTPTGSANYNVTLTPPNSIVTYNLNLYAGGNNTQVLTYSSPTTAVKQYTLTGGTTYYISVTGGLSFDCYSLVVSRESSAKTTNHLAGTTQKEPIVVSTEVLKVITYPNPHHGSFSLKIETPEEGLATIQLFTINGQLLTERQVYVQKEKDNIVLFESASLGTILYRVQIGKNLVAGKIIGRE